MCYTRFWVTGKMLTHPFPFLWTLQHRSASGFWLISHCILTVRLLTANETKSLCMRSSPSGMNTIWLYEQSLYLEVNLAWGLKKKGSCPPGHSSTTDRHTTASIGARPCPIPWLCSFTWTWAQFRLHQRLPDHLLGMWVECDRDVLQFMTEHVFPLGLWVCLGRGKKKSTDFFRWVGI